MLKLPSRTCHRHHSQASTLTQAFTPMSPFMQAYTCDLLHKKHEEAAAAAGDAGVLRVCVLGHTRLTITTPATFAAVLPRGVFLPRPAGFYNVFMMLVCPYHSEDRDEAAAIPTYPSTRLYTCPLRSI